MAVTYKIMQRKNPSTGTFGYGPQVYNSKLIGTEQVLSDIELESTVSKADLVAYLACLEKAMEHYLGENYVINVAGFLRLRIELNADGKCSSLIKLPATTEEKKAFRITNYIGNPRVRIAASPSFKLAVQPETKGGATKLLMVSVAK